MFLTKLKKINRSELNPIEIEAKRQGYFRDHLTNYVELHDLLLERKDNTSKKNAKKYWSACGKLLYAIFENLYFLWERNPNRPTAIKKHLPTFVAVFNISFTVTEYLVSLINLLIEVDASTMDKNRFVQVLKITNQEKRRDNLKLFLCKCYCSGILNRQEKDELEKKFDKIYAQHEIRHYLTHTFRFLWWYNDNSQVYGFQKIDLDNISKIKDEIWQSLDEKDYEASFSTSKNAITGVSLITNIHSILVDFINEILRLIYQFLNTTPNKANSADAKSRAAD